MDTVASLHIDYTQFLDETGRPVRPLPPFAEDREEMLAMYRTMVLTRQFDAKAVALQRTGQLGTYASSLGQEAMGAAIGRAMHAQDLLLPAYREYAAMLQRGVTMTHLLLYWGGDERGMAFPGEDFPICVPVGSHACHAVGVAQAFKYRREPRVAVCVLGDGATSKGDFYESINIAGAWELPVVFVINNNQWAISVPRDAQTRAETLAQKCVAAGIPGEQVDGNDVIAVRAVFEQYLERAREGGGPGIIEALTYRLCDHTTADDAARYRPEDEVRSRWRQDPIARLRVWLSEARGWAKADEEALQADCARAVKTAVDKYLDTPPQRPQSMFDHLYASLPAILKSQREAAGKEE